MEIEKMLDDFDVTLTNVVDKLEILGWTLPTELNIYPINVIGKTDEIENIDKFLLRFFQSNEYEKAKQMVANIKKTPITMQYHGLIEECWLSFMDKRYIVTGNSLITIIEGLLSTFWENKNNTRMMQVCQAKVDELSLTKTELIEKHIWISYNKFIRKLFEPSDFTEPEPDNINRHWFLHGRSEYEIEEIDCLIYYNSLIGG